MTLETHYPLAAYREPSGLVDFMHPDIQRQAAEHRATGREDIDLVRDAFEFVRDQVHHSWDIGSRRVTARASDVLRWREGICYAKSHLLAALLRAMGIPAGLCYQKLTLGETSDTGHCIHGLNTVYLSSLKRWIRLDARGNKPGVDARFSLDGERLAFPVRPEYGEHDYGMNYPQPHPTIVQTLAAHTDCQEMCARHLPTDL